MRRILLATFALGLFAWAQGPALTTVADIIYGGSGTITVVAQQTFTTADGYVVPKGWTATVTLGANGSFEIGLPPNVGSAPSGTYYTAYYNVVPSGQYTETWIVPSNPATVNLAAVRSLLPPTPSFLFALSQIADPCPSGQGPTSNGTSWVCASTSGLNNPMTTVGDLVVGGSGGVPQRLATGASNQFLAGGTSWRAITSGDLPATITSNTSGNAATASALAVAPSQCAANEYATGVTAAGAANCAQPNFFGLLGSLADGQLPADTVRFSGTITDGDCADWSSTGIVKDAGAPCGSGGSGMVYPAAGIANSTGSAWTTPYQVGTTANDLPQINSSDLLTVGTTGNAATATAFAAVPSDCGAIQRATGIAANGNAVCVDTGIAARSVTAATDTVQALDDDTIIYFTGTTLAETLPTPATLGVPYFFTIIQNAGAGAVTVTPASYTINGASSLTISPGVLCTVYLNPSSANAWVANCADSSPASAGVASFNGRTGAVTPANGDYSFGLLSGLATLAQLPTGCSGCVLLGQGSGTAPAYVSDPEVQGLGAAGSATTGNPVLIGGSDGTDVRTFSTDSSGRLDVNVNGTVPVSGTFWQATQPVSLASLPALAAGSNTIGGVNQAGSWSFSLSGTGAVNLTQLDGTALGAPTAWGTAPSGNVLGVNANIVTMPQVTLAAGQSVNIGNFPATQPVSGTVSATAGTGFPIVPTASAAINDSSSGLTQIVAAVAGKSIYVTGYTVVANAAVAVQWEYGTGTACSTGTTALTGPMSFAANGGAAPHQTLFVPSGDALCLNLGGAVQVGGSVSYAQQ